MTNPEVISFLEQIERWNVSPSEKHNEALVYAITMLERVEKVLNQNRFKLHEIAFILRGEEF